MKPNEDDKSPADKFDDEVTALIDGASEDLTCAEMGGVLELQLHILKNRITGYRQAEKE